MFLQVLGYDNEELGNIRAVSVKKKPYENDQVTNLFPSYFCFSYLKMGIAVFYDLAIFNIKIPVGNE